MAESFFATLKAELVYRRAWPTRHELEMEVFSCIEGFYNPRRRHSRLDNLSPADVEKMLTTQNEASACRGSLQESISPAGPPPTMPTRVTITSGPGMCGSSPCRCSSCADVGARRVVS
jgi:hypothetical protein